MKSSKLSVVFLGIVVFFCNTSRANAQYISIEETNQKTQKVDSLSFSTKAEDLA